MIWIWLSGIKHCYYKHVIFENLRHFLYVVLIYSLHYARNLLNLLEFLAEAFRCHVHHFQCLTVLVELASMIIYIRNPIHSLTQSYTAATTSLLTQQLRTGTFQPVPPGPSSVENDAHGIEKLLLKLK